MVSSAMSATVYLQQLGCRDEVLAEWRVGSGGCASLHVHCHVSGEERWLAPPGLRDFIFRREMPLVRAVCVATGMLSVIVA